MSLRSLAALGLSLFLWGCSVPSRPADPAIDEIERRHEDMLMRGLGAGTGSGM
jgi:hypothetical protein